MNKIIFDLNKLVHAKSQILVAIDGRSGAGKSTLTKNIATKVANVEVAHLDEYDLYQGQSSFQRVIKEIILPFKSMKKSSKIIVLEGVFALDQALIDYYDYKIWVEIEKEIGYKRGLQRDIVRNGHDNSQQWESYWLPKEDWYISTQQPSLNANIIIQNN